MRDAQIISLNQEEELIITTDNSGAIGSKEKDIVKVPYKVVSYFSFRVAMMEALASRALPISIVLQNYCGNDVWEELVSGIEKGINELDMEAIPITGSTESNFELTQSAIGLTIIGKRKVRNKTSSHPIDKWQRIALLGLPLVGDEVIHQSKAIVPLSLVKEISQIDDVHIWPIGSKGILHEMKRMVPGLDQTKIDSAIDLHKSGGPATAMLVWYSPSNEDLIKRYAREHFYPLWEGEA